MDRDTIFALSSGRPPAGIAVVRVCGPRAGEALRLMTGRVPSPRVAALVATIIPFALRVGDVAIAGVSFVALVSYAIAPRGPRRAARVLENPT